MRCSDDALFQCGVVAPATQAQHAPNLLLLLESRVESILVGLARHLLFHSYLFCLIGA
jgi:hypothetical protein